MSTAADGPSNAATREYWSTLSRGCYLEDGVCPSELLEQLVAALQLCLGAADVHLQDVHVLKKRYAKEAGAAVEASDDPKAKKQKLAEVMRRVALATSPNFKDVLRARVFASAHFEELLRLWRVLVRQHVLPLLAARLGERAFAVQRQPSIRFNLPGASALGARPDDDDAMVGLHRDGDYGHQPGEMNLLLALTPFYGSNGLFVETEPGLADYTEVRLPPGGLFAFHGVSRAHHNQRNATPISRVSMDFRGVPARARTRPCGGVRLGRDWRRARRRTSGPTTARLARRRSDADVALRRLSRRRAEVDARAPLHAGRVLRAHRAGRRVRSLRAARLRPRLAARRADRCSCRGGSAPIDRSARIRRHVARAPRPQRRLAATDSMGRRLPRCRLCAAGGEAARLAHDGQRGRDGARAGFGDVGCGSVSATRAAPNSVRLPSL